MKRFLFAVMLVSGTFCISGQVFAYVLIGYKWIAPTTEIGFSLGTPWNEAFVTAINRWNQASVFKFTYSDEVSDPCSVGSTPHNTGQFSSSVCGDSFGSTSLAVTLTWIGSDTTWGNKRVPIQSGILFNNAVIWANYDAPWGSGQWAGKNDFRRVAVHELGHVIGLDHDYGLNVLSIMTSSIFAGSSVITPQSTDIEGINDLYFGTGDTTGPVIRITGYSDSPPTVTTENTVVSGTASDASAGGWGVASVSVNGVGVDGATAPGSETVNWSSSVSLHGGMNNVKVVAQDSSANHNAAAAVMRIFYRMPNGGTSAVSSRYHLFPRFAAGKLTDRTSYASTLMVVNPNWNLTSTCTLRVYGAASTAPVTTTFSLFPVGWMFVPIGADQPFQSGYVTLQCSQSVDAQLSYTLYDAQGAKLSEATIFSSQAASVTQILADNREGSRTAIGIANDSDQRVSYTVTVSDVNEMVIGTTSLTLEPRSSHATFLDELLRLPPGFYGRVLVSASSGAGSLIGIRYTNQVFGTIPQTIRSGSPLTAGPVHIFPRFASGPLPDGSNFRTTLMMSNPGNARAECALSLYDVNGGPPTVSSFLIPAAGWVISPISDTGTLQSGYASLKCSHTVEAQLLYSFYSPAGSKIAESTIYSSPPGEVLWFLGDSRENSKIAIAIANDSDQPIDYSIMVLDENPSYAAINGTLPPIPPKSSKAVFIDEFFPGGVAPNVHGPVIINSRGPLSVSGFRFTGPVFTTIPETLK